MTRYLQGESHELPGGRIALGDYQGRNFLYAVQGKVAAITLHRPERKNPLTLESYAELRDLFRAMCYAEDVKAVVLTGAGGNFCSGGDVHEIIGPLTKLDMPSLLAFTRMTGDLVKAMRNCPQTILAAVDGVCAGAGAILAMASDLRFGTARSKTAFLFTRVGLAGCDMGACALLPRLIGQGRAAEFLYTGRNMSGEEGERCGFFNRLCAPESLLSETQAFAAELCAGPTFAHAMTKKMMQQEWNMGLDEAIEAEAQAQAICMATNDFHRAYHAFVAKQKPVFEGN
jgi:enoyl-CoA hydratase/carnithine racemase